MFRLVTAPLSVRLLPNIVTKPKPYFLNVRWSNSSSKTDRISKNHQNAFIGIMDTNGDGFISTEDFVEGISKRFAATVGPPQEIVDRLQAVLSKTSAKVSYVYNINSLIILHFCPTTQFQLQA